MNKINFELQAIEFLNKLFLTLDKTHIEISSHWDIDHLCYRVDSLKRYEELKKSFLNLGKLLIESDINGRSISTFKLNSPITFKHWTIDVVELPAPKLSKPIKEGFEHIEVVCDLSFDELEEKYIGLQLDLGGLKKEINLELEIVLGEKNIKFHHMSLESVIRIETNKTIFRAIEDSNILRSFKIYTPFIAGAFPLGIHTKNSDVDILMYAIDLNGLEKSLKIHYENHDGFESLRSFDDGLETLIVNFNQGNIPFEIVAQSRPIVEQKAYKYFHVEERLLKLGGELFKEVVMGIRMDGTKNEPAMVEALNIETNPYNELLILQKASEVRLKSILESVMPN